MGNVNVQLSLDEAVREVLGLLTGLELQYQPEYDRYRAITRVLNRALRANALEAEWSCYSDTEEVGIVIEGEREVNLRSSIRPRITLGDCVRLLDANQRVVAWVYFLPRDSLAAYDGRGELRCSVTRTSLMFSRPFLAAEAGLTIVAPVMREPQMFRLPDQPEDPNADLVDVPASIRQQTVDFDYPDLVIARAAYFYAQTDPVMQPRVPTLEQNYKTLMYQLIERDGRHTDAPLLGDFFVPIVNGINGPTRMRHRHPHADGRRV